MSSATDIDSDGVPPSSSQLATRTMGQLSTWEEALEQIHSLRSVRPLKKIPDKLLSMLWTALDDDAKELFLLQTLKGVFVRPYDVIIERFETCPGNPKLQQLLRARGEWAAMIDAAKFFRKTAAEASASPTTSPSGPSLETLPDYDETWVPKISDLPQTKIRRSLRLALLSVRDGDFVGFLKAPQPDYRIQVASSYGEGGERGLKIVVKITMSIEPDGQTIFIDPGRHPKVDEVYESFSLEYDLADMVPGTTRGYFNHPDVPGRMHLPPESLTDVYAAELYCIEFTPRPSFFARDTTILARRANPTIYCDGPLGFLRPTVAALFAPGQHIRICVRGFRGNSDIHWLNQA